MRCNSLNLLKCNCKLKKCLTQQCLMYSCGGGYKDLWYGIDLSLLKYRLYLNQIISRVSYTFTYI